MPVDRPARAVYERSETDKTAPILHRVLPGLFQRTESKTRIRKQSTKNKKVMEKKQSTTLEKTDTITLALSILFVASILCTVLFSLTA